MNEELATNCKESYYHVSLVLGDCIVCQCCLFYYVIESCNMMKLPFEVHNSAANKARLPRVQTRACNSHIK